MEKELKIGDKVKYSYETGYITGFDGTYWRIFLNSNGNMHHEWATTEELEKIEEPLKSPEN